MANETFSQEVFLTNGAPDLVVLALSNQVVSDFRLSFFHLLRAKMALPALQLVLVYLVIREGLFAVETDDFRLSYQQLEHSVEVTLVGMSLATASAILIVLRALLAND